VQWKFTGGEGSGQWKSENNKEMAGLREMQSRSLLRRRESESIPMARLGGEKKSFREDQGDQPEREVEGENVKLSMGLRDQTKL